MDFLRHKSLISSIVIAMLFPCVLDRQFFPSGLFIHFICPGFKYCYGMLNKRPIEEEPELTSMSACPLWAARVSADNLTMAMRGIVYLPAAGGTQSK